MMNRILLVPSFYLIDLLCSFLDALSANRAEPVPS